MQKQANEHFAGRSRGLLSPRGISLSSACLALLLAACEDSSGDGPSGLFDASPSGQPPGAGDASYADATSPVVGADASGGFTSDAGGTFTSDAGGVIGGQDAQVAVTIDAGAGPGATLDASSADASEPGEGSDASPGDAGAQTTGEGGAAPVETCLPTATARPGETTKKIQVGGVSRSYILHIPQGYTGKSPVPLVIDWHPIFGSGSGERGSSGYAQLSDKEGFIVAFPDGIDRAWNVGPCCTLSRTVDDLGFARALVAEIERDACVDPKRVYATGFSMGGGMTHYLACNAADVFAAAAPSSFDLLTEDEEPCHPARPITVISFRGTADPVVPYKGGPSNPPNGLPTIHFLGAEGTFNRWKELNGCTGTPTMASGCATYANCKGGVETTLCTIQGGGHATGDAKLGWATMKRFTLP